MRASALVPLSLLALSVAACQSEPAPAPAADSTAVAPDTSGAILPLVVSATLEPRSGSNVTGTVTFTKEATGVRVVANLAGLTPGDHGFHVHENGDCSAPDASSAGGHFNPGGHPHGAPSSPDSVRHAGDLGNLTADAQGNATLDLTDAVLHVSGPNSIVGKAVVVHEKADDFGQPVGNAGGRVACGVLTTAGGTAGAPLSPGDDAHEGDH